MDPTRLRRVEELFSAALERERDSRARYLDRACAGDAELRSEVEALLHDSDDAFAYFDDMVGKVASGLPAVLQSASTERSPAGASSVAAETGFAGASGPRPRSRLLTALLLAGFLVAAGVAGFLGVRSARLAAERDRAERLARWTGDLLRLTEPLVVGGDTITAGDLLDRASHRIETELAGQPEIQARLLDVVGRGYQSLGLHGKARRSFERSLGLRRRRASGPGEVAESLYNLGNLLLEQGEVSAGETYLREALRRDRQAFGHEHERVARDLVTLGHALRASQGCAEAVPLLAEALEIRRRVLQEDDPALAETEAALRSCREQSGETR